MKHAIVGAFLGVALLAIAAGAASAGATAVPAAAPVAAPAAAPAELVFDDLVLVKPTFLRKDRQGRLLMRGDVFTWVDNRDPMESFTFQATGLKEVWFTCEARTPKNFCYQINLKIVKGDRYRFRDIHRDSGSNAAVTKIMEALRTYFPRLAFGAPDN